MCGGQGIESTGGFHQLEGTTQIPPDFDTDFCAGHEHPHRSVHGFEMHPGSVGLVEVARSMRDYGKQPAEIIAALLELHGEELPDGGAS